MGWVYYRWRTAYPLILRILTGGSILALSNTATYNHQCCRPIYTCFEVHSIRPVNKSFGQGGNVKVPSGFPKMTPKTVNFSALNDTYQKSRVTAVRHIFRMSTIATHSYFSGNKPLPIKTSNHNVPVSRDLQA